MWASGAPHGVVTLRSGDGVDCGMQTGSPVTALCGLSGGQLAVACLNGTVAIYEAPVWGSRRPLRRLRWYEHPCRVVCAVALSAGALVSAGADGGMLRLAPAFESPEPLLGHTSRVGCLLQLRDGSLASGSRDSTVRIWQGSRCLGTLAGHDGEVICLAELSSGVLASGAADRTVRLWAAGCCLRVLRGHRGAVRALAALPSGALASGGPQDPPRIWW